VGPGFDFDKGHAYTYVRSKKTATMTTDHPVTVMESDSAM